MAPGKSKGGKMLSLINWRLKVTLNDGRTLTGQMLAFDKHMNLVIVDCEEFRRVKSKKKGEEAIEQELKRTLGLIILRGETIVSISVEGPPPAGDDEKKSALPAGPGRGIPAGRGIGMMPPGIVPPPAMAGRPMPFGAPPGMPPGMPFGRGGPPPGFPPGMPFPPPGFSGPPPGFQPPQ